MMNDRLFISPLTLESQLPHSKSQDLRLFAMIHSLTQGIVGRHEGQLLKRHFHRQTLMSNGRDHGCPVLPAIVVDPELVRLHRHLELGMTLGTCGDTPVQISPRVREQIHRSATHIHPIPRHMQIHQPLVDHYLRTARSTAGLTVLPEGSVDCPRSRPPFTHTSTPLPKARARCVNSARRGLCGGCRATGIPTATYLLCVLQSKYSWMCIHCLQNFPPKKSLSSPSKP